MLPTKIEGDAIPIGAPPNWRPDHGHCGALFVRVDQTPGGLQFMRSAWEANAEEAGWLLAGAKVQLGVSAPQHPVVQLGVGPVPDDFEPVMTVRSILDGGQPAVRVEMMWKRPSEEARRIFCQVIMNGDQRSKAVALAIDEIEQLARSKAWL